MIFVYRYPYEYGSLAIIDGNLTAIGGYTSVVDIESGSGPTLSIHYRYTDNLLSHRNRDASDNWKAIFPCMPTKRSDTSAITAEEHLIVAGGGIGEDKLTECVEVMNIREQQWSTVASLLHPYGRASITICGEYLYMLGGFGVESEITTSVLTCTLTELLQSAATLEPSKVWSKLADTPFYLSTCASLDEELLVVSGCDNTVEPTKSIYKYSPKDNSWRLYNIMPTARYCCLISVFSTNELMVVGGFNTPSNVDTVVEIGTFTN